MSRPGLHVQKRLVFLNMDKKPLSKLSLYICHPCICINVNQSLQLAPYNTICHNSGRRRGWAIATLKNWGWENGRRRGWATATLKNWGWENGRRRGWAIATLKNWGWENGRRRGWATATLKNWGWENGRRRGWAIATLKNWGWENGRRRGWAIATLKLGLGKWQAQRLSNSYLKTGAGKMAGAEVEQ